MKKNGTIQEQGQLESAVMGAMRNLLGAMGEASEAKQQMELVAESCNILEQVGKDKRVVEENSDCLEQGQRTSAEKDMMRLLVEIEAALDDHTLRTQFRQNVLGSAMADEEKLKAIVAMEQHVVGDVDAELGAEN